MANGSQIANGTTSTPKLHNTPSGRTAVFRSNAEWAAIRARYEHARPKITLRLLSAELGVAYFTLRRRATVEHWQWRGDVVNGAEIELRTATSNAMAQAAAKTAEMVAARVMDDLQPFIEREKRRHIKAQVKRGKRFLGQLDKLGADTPKDHAFVAQAADKWDNITRRNLGMNDQQAIGGPFSSGVLVNHGAVQFVSTPNA